MNTKARKEKSAVKTTVSSSFKVQFKLLCVQKELTISYMLEKIVRDFIQSHQDLPKNLENLKPSLHNLKIVKGYIPKSLKFQFKVFCTQKQIPMNLVLSHLIETWVEKNNQ